jgi:hypothetical protein
VRVNAGGDNTLDDLGYEIKVGDRPVTREVVRREGGFL